MTAIDLDLQLAELHSAALLGLTDEQIANELGIGTTSLERWQAAHPESN